MKGRGDAGKFSNERSLSGGGHPEEDSAVDVALLRRVTGAT
jgi:hypothetical protein